MITSEVSVVAGDDGVLLSLLSILSVPLANARSTGISEHNTAKSSHGVGEPVLLNGGSDLLTARGDVEVALCLHALSQGLLHQTGHPAHVLVGRVCAGSNKTVPDLKVNTIHAKT